MARFGSKKIPGFKIYYSVSSQGMAAIHREYQKFRVIAYPMFSKDRPKARSYWIGAICVLILFVTAYTLAHLASQPAEPWVSVSFFHNTNHLDGSTLDSEGVFYKVNGVTVEVSNRMSFPVDYVILADVKPSSGSGTYLANIASSYSIGARSNKWDTFGFRLSVWEEATRWRVLYARQLNPIEKSIFTRWPWLKKHYPFHRWHTLNLSAPVLDTHIIELKAQPATRI